LICQFIDLLNVGKKYVQITFPGDPEPDVRRAICGHLGRLRCYFHRIVLPAIVALIQINK